MLNFPLWYIPISFYFLFATSYSLLQRKASQTTLIPPRLMSFLILGFFLYPIAVTIALLSGNLHVTFSPLLLVLLLTQALLIGLFNTAPFRLNKHIDATQYIIINNIYTPIVVAIGVFMLHETFTAKQFVGTLLLVIGAIMVAIKNVRSKAWKLDRYSWELILLSIFFGIGLAAEKASLGQMSLYAYFIIGWGMQIAVTGWFARKELHLIPKISTPEWMELTKLGLVRCGQVFGYIFSLSISNNIPLIASVTSFRIPLVFIASYFLLKERDHLPRKVAGVVIATIGLLLL